jgi:polysaccharide biosynthesis protein PslH
VSSRTLFLSTFAPALGSGRALRTFTCVKALSLLGPVDIVFTSHDGTPPAPEYQALPGLELHEVTETRGPGRIALYATERLRGTPASCSRGSGPRLIAAAMDLHRATAPARVVAGDTHAATALMRLQPRLPFVYNAHNVESDRAQAGSSRHRAMLRYERRLLTAADETWMVSRADVETARRLAPVARIRYVPNVVDTAAIRPPQRPHGGRNLLMIGDFTYAPNQSARDYLADTVLPRVRAQVPEARLTLVGRGLEQWQAPDPSVEVAGFVPDLASAYGAADCVVVPLLEGAGSPLKFVEALAYGMPIVATPRAAAGLEVEAGRHYLEGADPDAFADAVVRVLRDGGDELGAAARALAEHEYSVEALAERIAA